MDNANLNGADLHGATGISAAQICSARWQGALIDAELLGEVQGRCGSGAASVAANSVQPASASQGGTAQVAATPADAGKQTPVTAAVAAPANATPGAKTAPQVPVNAKAKAPEPVAKGQEKKTVSTGLEVGKTKNKAVATTSDQPKAKTKVAAAPDTDSTKTKKKAAAATNAKSKTDAAAKTGPDQR